MEKALLGSAAEKDARQSWRLYLLLTAIKALKNEQKCAFERK